MEQFMGKVQGVLCALALALVVSLSAMHMFAEPDNSARAHSWHDVDHPEYRGPVSTGFIQLHQIKQLKNGQSRKKTQSPP